MSGSEKHPRLPAPPATLDREAAARLDQLVGAALSDQRRATQAALERVFDHMPRLLRAPIRKILGG